MEPTATTDAGTPAPLPRYWAFISYSHQDKIWGDWLHRSVETYAVPRTLVASGAPARVFPVFRDREELSGAVKLTDKIEGALRESRTLIVVCSPRSASSRWVNEEIRRFAQLGRANRIFALIVDGEPHSQIAAQECFPPALRYEFSPDGSLTDQPADYLAADARPEGDGKKNALLKLIAGILDVDYDKLKRRDHERRMRLRAVWIGALSALTVLLAGIAGYALIERGNALRSAHLAEDRRKIAEVQTVIATEQKQAAVVSAALAEDRRKFAEQQTAIATEQKRVAVSRQLAAQALSQMTTKIDLALLLAVESARPEKTFDANNSLLKVLQSAPGLVTILHGHAGRVTQLAFSPDGNLIASGGVDSTVRIWDPHTGKSTIDGPLYRHTNQTNGEDEVRTISFSPDGSVVASGSFAGTLRWADLKQNKVGVESKFGASISALAFAPDGQALAGGNGIGRYDLRADKQVGPAFSVGGSVMFGPTAVAISPDGKLVASTKMDLPDEGLYLFDTSNQRSVGERIADKFPLIDSLQFSSDSSRLAAGSPDGSVRIWDVAERKVLGPPLTCDGGVLAMEFNASGSQLAWACAGGSVRVWNIDRWAAERDPVIVGAAESAAFSPDGTTIALGSTDGSVRIWDLRESHHALGQSIPTGTWMDSAAISPDGKYAVVGGDGTDVWTFESGQASQPLEEDKLAQSVHLKGLKPFSMAFSRNGRKFVTAGQYGVGLYEMPSGTLFHLPSATKEPYNWGVAITPDGSKLAFGGKGLTVWDVARKSPLPFSLQDKKSVFAVAISPDGSVLADGGETKQVRLWDMATGKSIGPPISFGQGIWSLAFSPDGRVLAAGGDDGRLQLWDARTRLPLGGPVPGFPSRIDSIAFSPDGLLMVAAGSHRQVVLYDLTTRMPLGDPLFPDSEYEVIATAAFSPDGKKLLLVDRRQKLFLLAGGPTTWTARACRIANRNLTTEEWTRYIGDQPYEKTCPDLPGPPAKRGSKTTGLP